MGKGGTQCSRKYYSCEIGTQARGAEKETDPPAAQSLLHMVPQQVRPMLFLAGSNFWFCLLWKTEKEASCKIMLHQHAIFT